MECNKIAPVSCNSLMHIFNKLARSATNGLLIKKYATGIFQWAFRATTKKTNAFVATKLLSILSCLL